MKINTISEFKTSLSLAEPPGEVSLYEKALWYAGKGDWEKAHNIVQEMNDNFSSLVHAFLHRQEGDLSNARYWYDRAGSRMPVNTIDEEWERLVNKFLAE